MASLAPAEVRQIRKVSGSKYLALPKKMIDGMGWRVNESIKITQEGGRLILEPLEGTQNRRKLTV